MPNVETSFRDELALSCEDSGWDTSSAYFVREAEVWAHNAKTPASPIDVLIYVNNMNFNIVLALCCFLYGMKSFTATYEPISQEAFDAMNEIRRLAKKV